jgi:hypothetical protein
MYTARSEPLKDPHRVKPPRLLVAEEPLPFVEACTVDFTGKPTKQRQAAASQQLTVKGNASLQNASANNSRPSTPAATQAAQDAIGRYREALLKDPYNAEATLKLALAYDRVLRKGCALAMLRRLETLAASPSFESEAVPMVDLVVQNPHWFNPYYNDALEAVGH